MSIINQVRNATYAAEDSRRAFSDLRTRFVCNGQGRMSQDWFAEMMARRNAPGAY